jgi:histidyl-tRNA synthetase
MHDVSQESSRRKRDLQDRLTDLIGALGYRHLETPILEPTDLFLRKSAGQLASRIYSFTDPGSSLVSLRPEFTSSIMRHYVEHDTGIDLPARWQYSGPVFRYEVSHPEASGQFTQVGAELLGSSSVMADAEVLGLTAEVLAHLGVTDWRLELADLDVLNSVLNAVGVSERARTFIIGSVPRLRRGRQAVPSVLEEAQKLRIVGGDADDDYLGQATKGLSDSQARVVLRGLLNWSAADQLGQRDPDEVVNRLLRKLRGSDSEETLIRGLELASDLAVVEGEPKDALSAAGALVAASGADESAFDRFSELLDLLQSNSRISGRLVLDFGLVRDLAYYNGVVFEVTHPDWPGTLGGGGRYDGLALALGSRESVPALGFAYNLEALLALSGGGDDGSEVASPSPLVLVVAEDASSYRQALMTAETLRHQGVPAELEVSGRGLEAALSYASKKGITQLIVVNHDGRRTTHTVD